MKKKKYISRLCGWFKCGLLSALLLSSGNMFADDVSEGLILHYNFDDLEVGNGNSVTDIMGNYPATAYGNFQVAEGRTSESADKSIRFVTQASPATDYIHLPSNVTSNLENFTISTWVKLDNTSTWARVFDFGSGTATNMFFTPNSGNNSRFAIKLNSTSGEQIVNGSSILPTNEWVHVVVTGDYSVNTAKLYINGVLSGENKAVTTTPKSLGETLSLNYIGRAQYNDPGLIGCIDDFRVYDRALSLDEIYALYGYTPDQVAAITQLETVYNTLTEELLLNGNDPLGVDAPLYLADWVIGSEDVIYAWESSDPDVVATDGTVTLSELPQKVTLTVSLSHPDIDLILTKTFSIITAGKVALPKEVAVFTFEDSEYKDGKIYITSKSKDNNLKYTGTLENEASVRTIGESTQYKVLDLGTQKGYFNMGTEIGGTVCKLTNYTMSAYFMVENDATSISGAGNFLWTFSNSDNVSADKNGYFFFRPYNNEYNVTKTYYTTSQSIYNAQHYTLSDEEGKVPYLGRWHHVLYSQTGATGTVYVDGVEVTTGKIDILPLNITVDGRVGTEFNFLGRSPYASDGYMNKTLIHNFTVYGYGMLSNEISELGVNQELAKLNAAYEENPDYNEEDDLEEAYDALNIDDLNLYGVTLTGKITLPTSLDGYPMVNISWSASNKALMGIDGEIIQPDFYDYVLTKITARLYSEKSGKVMNKEFEINATVPMKEGTALTDGKLVHFDFGTENVQDRIVTDIAQAGFEAELKNEATIRTIGESGETEVFNVLDLGNGTGYLDMGSKVGQVMYNLDADHGYTIMAYYRIDEDYATLDKAGNFLWTFSNSPNTNTAGAYDGYFMLSMGAQRTEMSPGNFNNAEAVTYYLDENNVYSQSNKGIWQFVAITGDPSMLSSTYYVYNAEEGLLSRTGSIPEAPHYYLKKDDKLGTPYNWIGRPNFGSDSYLKKTLVYDFRIYNKALDAGDFEGGEFDVYGTLEKLNAAYDANPNASGLHRISETSPYQVYADGKTIHITGLTGKETISLYDMTGRQLRTNASEAITVDSGIYIVRINNHVTRVIVK